MLADHAARHGDWLIARRQTAGRGRQGRSWESIDGNFLGSVLVLLEETDPPATLLSLVAGLAIAEALAAVPPRFSPTLKWPNDVMQGRAKLGGILLERQDKRVVVGFGVNLAIAPPIPGRATASLDGAVTPEVLAPVLAGAFENNFRRWRSEQSTDWLIEAWVVWATPPGTPLSVHDGSGRILEGLFAGLEPDGALRLRAADGRIEVIRAADVFLR